MKSKCFKCHRLRIHPEKIEAYTVALKFLKAGELVGSAKLKSWGLTGSKNSSLIDKKDLTDPNKLKTWASAVDALLSSNKSKNKDIHDLTDEFCKIDSAFSERKADYSDKLEDLKDKVIEDSKAAREQATE